MVWKLGRLVRNIVISIFRVCMEEVLEFYDFNCYFSEMCFLFRILI